MSIVLLIKTATSAYIGCDSKMVNLGTSVADAMPARKITHIGDVAFAHIGIFNDSHGKINVERTAEAAISAGGDVGQIAEHFATAIEPQLSAFLSDMRRQNLSYFRENLQRPLEILFASYSGGKAQALVTLFTVVDASSDTIAVRATHMRAPDASCTIGLGMWEAADSWLAKHPAECQTNPVAAIREAIEYQASSTPDLIALPISFLSLDASGVRRFDAPIATQPSVAPGIGETRPRFRFRLPYRAG